MSKEVDLVKEKLTDDLTHWRTRESHPIPPAIDMNIKKLLDDGALT